MISSSRHSVTSHSTEDSNSILLPDSPQNRSKYPNVHKLNENGYGTVPSKEKLTENSNSHESIEEEYPAVSIFGVFRYASGTDRLLLLFAIVMSFAAGMVLPLQSLIMANVSTTFIRYQPYYAARQFDGVVYNQTQNDTQIDEDFMTYANTIAIYYVVLSIAILASNFAQYQSWVYVGERMTNRLRIEFFKAIMRQEISWFDKSDHGSLVQKANDNLERFKEGTGDKLGMSIAIYTQFIVGFGMSLAYSWQLTLVVSALLPVIGGSTMWINYVFSTLFRRQGDLYSEAGRRAEEAIGNIRTVIAFNGQQQELERYRTPVQRAHDFGIRIGYHLAASASLMDTSTKMGAGLCVWYGAKLVVGDQIDTNAVFVVFFALVQSQDSIGRAANQSTLFFKAKAAVPALYAVIDRIPKIDSYSAKGLRPTSTKGKIELKDLQFAYPSRPTVKVLKGISLTIEPGEVVAIVGSSGSGKSTIVNLLLRFYDIQEGKLLINGISVSDYNIQALRHMIGVVSQEPVLFDNTIEYNLRLARPNLSMKEIVKACKLANIHDFISKLSNGYKTLCGERGAQLSGGQKQRIAIARALLRNPKILLLDEATSALDSESEKIVQTALERAQAGRTTIVIAHRLSTIRNAHRIVAMSHGQIMETGTHDELMEKRGLYYDLVHAQQMEQTENEENHKEKPKIITPRKSISGRRSHRLTTGRTSISSAVSLLGDGEKPSLLARVIDTNERVALECVENKVEMASISRLLQSARPWWPYLLVGQTLSLIEGLWVPGGALLINFTYTIFSAQTDAEMSRLADLGFLMYGTYGAYFALSTFVLIVAYTKFMEGSTMDLRMRVYTKLLSQSVSYFDKPEHATGKLAVRLATDTQNVRNALDWRLGQVTNTVVCFIAGMTIALVINWQLSLIIFAIWPVLAVAEVYHWKARNSFEETNRILTEEAGKILTDVVSNMRTVQALGCEHQFIEEYNVQLAGLYKQAIKSGFYQAASISTLQTITFVFSGVTIYVGALLVLANILTPIKIFQVLNPIQLCAAPLGFAASYFPEFFKARMSLGLIFGILDEKSPIDNWSDKGGKPEINGAIEVKHVNFSYESRPDTQILKKMSLDIKQGTTLALVGPSGCGKSTIVSLLERFYDAESGEICLDGIINKSFHLRYLRSKMSLVQQEPVLFDSSIMENIMYGLENASRVDAITCAKAANIHSFVQSLPEGYETRVGEKGTQLSGGQKQRIAIARSLMRSPNILLLDEATSALDTESEKIVQQALDSARTGRTCIMIAHRLSTVQNADKIAVVRAGEIIQYGNHNQLMAQDGLYKGMVEKQQMIKKNE